MAKEGNLNIRLDEEFWSGPQTNSEIRTLIPCTLSHCQFQGKETWLSLAVQKRESRLGAELPRSELLEMSAIAMCWSIGKGGSCKQWIRGKEQDISEPQLAFSDFTSSWGPELHRVWDMPWFKGSPSKVLECFRFFRTFVSHHQMCGVKTDCCHHNKTLLNPERTAPSIKKSFSLVSF